MRIKNLYLKNFRNYAEETFDFSEGLNVLLRREENRKQIAQNIGIFCYFVSVKLKLPAVIPNFGVNFHDDSL